MMKWMLGLCVAGLCLTACTTAPLPTSTPRPMPTRTATVAPTAVLTGVAHGELLFNTYQPQAGFACATCHYPQLERRLIGPGMTNLATRFPTYGLTMSLDEYLYQAIVQPNEFLAPSDPPYTVGVMPSNYGEIFTESELQDLIAYIKSL